MKSHPLAFITLYMKLGTADVAFVSIIGALFDFDCVGGFIHAGGSHA